MKYSELVVTGPSGRQYMPPPLTSSSVALTLHMVNASDGEGGGLPHSAGLARASSLLPSQTPVMLSCLHSGYLLRPKLNTQQSGGPPSMNRCPF